MRNLTESEHILSCQDVVCLALTHTFSVTDDSVTFKSQAAVDDKELRSVVNVLVSTSDFADTAYDTTGDALYSKLIASLQMAVETDIFTESVRNMSDGACFVHVTNVTFTASPYIVVLPIDSETEDNEELSSGELAGVVIGSVVGGLLLLWLLCWFMFFSAPSASTPVAFAPVKQDSLSAVATESNLETGQVVVDNASEQHEI